MSRKVPPFNDLAQPNMSRAAKRVMEEAMQKACDDQVKTLKEYEKRQIQETDKEKSKLDTKETVDFIIEHYGDVLRKLADS